MFKYSYSKEFFEYTLIFTYFCNSLPYLRIALWPFLLLLKFCSNLWHSSTLQLLAICYRHAALYWMAASLRKNAIFLFPVLRKVCTHSAEDLTKALFWKILIVRLFCSRFWKLCQLLLRSFYHYLLYISSEAGSVFQIRNN